MQVRCRNSLTLQAQASLLYNCFIVYHCCTTASVPEHKKGMSLQASACCQLGDAEGRMQPQLLS